MSLIDLSQVTVAYMNLLRLNINGVINSGGSPTVTITPEPPDKVGSVTNTLSIYAYHVAEDPYFKNTAAPGLGPPSVARAPMALSIYYILTAHHDSSGEEDALVRQRLMGWALKSFHDIPVITDATAIPAGDPPNVLPSLITGQGNKIQTVLRSITPEEAIGFWTTDDQATTRMSAYYEARVIMLEEEPPTRIPGIVLSVGTFVQQLGTPQIVCTRNELEVEIPGSADSTTLDSSPARVTLGQSDAMRLEGVNLSAGQRQTLTLRGNSTAPADLGPIVVDPTLNPGWNLRFLSDRVELDVQPTIALEGGGTVTLFPGTYTAQVEVVVASQVLAGEPREQTASSNEAQFWILPRIVGHTLAGGMRIDLQLDPPLDQIGGDPEFDVQLAVDGDLYELGTSPLPDGTFRIRGNGDVRFNPPFDTTPPTAERHVVQIIVNGAAGMPFDLELGP